MGWSSPAGWNTEDGWSVAAAGGAPGSPAYVFRALDFTETATNNHTASIDIGTASADRLIVVGFAARAGIGGAPSVTVNGVALTVDAYTEASYPAGIASGLVTSGSGPQTVVVNWTAANSGQPRMMSVWVLTGLSSNLVKQSTTWITSGAGSISVTAGDFVFAASMIQNIAPDYSGSTQAPSAVRNDTTYPVSGSADWIIAATNASFSVSSSAATNSGNAAATYR